MIINVRGANGSGKTTAVRWFLEGASEISLADYRTPKGIVRFVTGYRGKNDVCVVGPYKTNCGGLDAVPNFETTFRCLRVGISTYDDVLCEGVLSSTVFGSWFDFAKDMKAQGEVFALAYLRVSAAECIRRVYLRNGGKKINEDLIRDKVKAVEATRLKFKGAGFPVYDLPLEEGAAGPALAAIFDGTGEAFRAS